MFNLKDPRNPGLRADVLTGAIPADELVRMSPTDLANKDLQEMRREREAKIGEDAFLPDAPEGARVRKTHKGEEVMFDAREILEDEHVTGDGLGHRETPSLAPSDSFHTVDVTVVSNTASSYRSYFFAIAWQWLRISDPRE